ncbi:WASH complex subunit 2-like [Galendromus occidentalis]|uniref:WASH complex subunit 2-like n=1 Tax=Galendromus occidentalis TaxID=34638 RepID=A0AAJ6W013_9ACAR|nr:WASH complex subunit 2-like [Galendromus occidentalis]
MSFETGEWSLAKDKELIDRLEKHSAEFLAPLADVPKELDQLTTETAQLNLLLQNVVGDLNTLSEKRFIENRVAEAQDEKTPPTPEPEAKAASEEELREAVRTGLKAFGLLPVEELSDDDDRETGYECFARDRPFSLIIGSKQWLEADPFAGLTPVDTFSVCSTPISEAMEDLVLPSTTSPVASDLIEEATEAETWYQKERASISTQGTARPLDSDSESSVTSAVPKKTPLAPSLSDFTGSRKPRGLFDDDDSDDDGDLFGVSRKPSVSSVNRRGSRSSSSQASPQPTNVAPVATTPQEETTPRERNDIPKPVSFLEELKKKTGGRLPGDQQNVKSPPLTPTKSETAEKVSSPAPGPSSNQEPLARKKNSIFDSDSESDIFVPKAKPPKSFSEQNSDSRFRGNTLPSQKEGGQSGDDPQKPKKVQPDSRLRTKPSLFDSDSGEDGPGAVPKATAEQAFTKVSSPLDKTTQALPKLPKKNSLFDDSDSDSDIFGPLKRTTQKPAEKSRVDAAIPEQAESAQIVKPKEFRGVRVLPQIPVKLGSDKEVDREKRKSLTPTIDLSAPVASKPQVQSSSKPTIEPRSSDSEDETTKSKVKPIATRPQQFAPKLPNPFGDSGSDDDLFGASPTIKKPSGAEKTAAKPETIKKVPEVASSEKGSDNPYSATTISGKEEIPTLKKSIDLPQTQELPRDPSPELFVDPLTSTESGRAKSSDPTAVSKEERAPETKLTEKPNIGKAKLFSTDSESDEDLLLKPKSPAPTAGDRAGSLDTGKKSIIPRSKEPEDTPTESLQQTSRSEAQQSGLESRPDPPAGREGRVDSLPDSVSPAEDEPVKTMAEKSNAVKKIGMGLPAGLLQGLKARQQQLGIAKPEAGIRESASNEKTPEARPAAITTGSQVDDIVAMRSDHKDIVEIAKARARGPSGRRPPTRSAAKKKEPVQSSGEALPQAAVDAQVKVPIILKRPEPVPGESIERISAGKIDETVDQRDKGNSEPVVKRPSSEEELAQKKTQTVEDPLASADVPEKESRPSGSDVVQTATEPGKAMPKPETENKKESREDPRPKTKSIFASDSSDEDLFSPKAPPRKKSIPKENIIVPPAAKGSVPVKDDPLSASFASTARGSTGGPTQPVAPKRAEKSVPQKEKTEAKSPQIPASVLSKSLFSDSEDDDDGASLFGPKKPRALPKSATTSTLSAVKAEKPKLTQSKSSSANLFGSDSDSDELFKKK